MPSSPGFLRLQWRQEKNETCMTKISVENLTFFLTLWNIILSAALFSTIDLSLFYVVLFQVFSKTLTFQQTVLSIFCSFAKINSTYNVVMWWILLIQTERDIHNFSSKSKKNVLSKYRCFLKNICCIFLLVLN